MSAPSAGNVTPITSKSQLVEFIEQGKKETPTIVVKAKLSPVT